MFLNVKWVKKANMWCFSRHPERGEEVKPLVEFFSTKEEAEARLKKEQNG